MIRICIFVEGQTERILLEKLLSEYLGPLKFESESYKMLGDKLSVVRKRSIHSGIQIYALIYDVGSDGRVVSALLDRAEKMVKDHGYDHLIALRDLYPKRRDEKEAIIKKVKCLFNRFDFDDKLKFILAIMEVEAWFLADYSLFERIDTRLSAQYIKEKLAIDLTRDDPETYSHPAKVVNDIYQLIGRSYKKREKQCYEIVHKINYNYLYADEKVQKKISSFFYFLKHIDRIFSKV